MCRQENSFSGLHESLLTGIFYTFVRILFGVLEYLVQRVKVENVGEPCHWGVSKFLKF